MRFHKMQGAGNDFIIINNMQLGLPVEKLPALAARVCTRRLSLGGDALMAVDNPTGGGDFKMRFYNADGSEGEMCGNGARCIARYAYEEKLAGEEMVIETLAGDVQAWRLEKRLYKIRLNDPTTVDTGGSVEADGQSYGCDYVELGDPGIPHAVVLLENLDTTPDDDLRRLGREIRYHGRFAKGANVNFCKVLNSDTVLLKTYERGVEDLTLACGTGSGSTVTALKKRGLITAEQVRLMVPGGELFIETAEDESGHARLYLIGDTNRVAEGEITDEDLGVF